MRTELFHPTEENGEKDQAEYLRTVCSNLGPNVDKILNYELRDGSVIVPERENHLGLLTVNGTKKEAYNTVKNINRR